MSTTDTATIRQFLVHKSASKHRIFALNAKSVQLDAVTTLASGHDSTLADRLTSDLNDYLVSGDLDDLKPILDQLPDPVKMSVTAFLQSRSTPKPGDLTEWGEPVYPIRLAIMTDYEDLEYQMSAAYDLGLGARIHNQANSRGQTSWELDLRTDPGYAPVGSEARTWALPEGTPLRRSWVSTHARNDPTAAALMVAQQASEERKRTRLHIIERGLGAGPHPGTILEWVVDVFDAPIPAHDDD